MKFDRDFCYRRKMGFGLPLGEFLRDRRLQELWNDSLRRSMARRGWVEADVADGWIRQVVSGAHGSDSTAAAVWATEALWSTISLELWAQQCIDAVIPAGNEPGGPG